MPDRDKLIVFLHNGRAGGTTLRQIIRCEYAPGEVLTVAAKERSLGHLQAALADVDLSQTAVVQGHIPYGLDAFVERPCAYITLLRDPVERLISVFFAEVGKRGAERRLTPAVVRSFEAFLKTGLIGRRNKRLELDNAQTRRLSGANPPFSRCTPAILERALANLEEIEVAGLTERFDESVLLLKRRLGWRHVLSDRMNAAAWRPAAHDLPEHVVELIHDTNRFDLALYKAAAATFEHTIAAEGPTFAAELEQLRHLNELLTRALTLPRPEQREALAQAAASNGLSADDRTMLEANVGLILRDREAQQRSLLVRGLERMNASMRARAEEAEARLAQLRDAHSTARTRKAQTTRARRATRAQKVRTKPRVKKPAVDKAAKRVQKPRADRDAKLRAKAPRADRQAKRSEKTKAAPKARSNRENKRQLKADPSAKRKQKAAAKREKSSVTRGRAETLSH